MPPATAPPTVPTVLPPVAAAPTTPPTAVPTAVLTSRWLMLAQAPRLRLRARVARVRGRRDLRMRDAFMVLFSCEGMVTVWAASRGRRNRRSARSLVRLR